MYNDPYSPQLPNHPPTAPNPVSSTPGPDPYLSFRADRTTKTRMLALIITTLLSVGLLIVTIILAAQLHEANANVEGKIREAEALAVNTTTTRLEANFAKREKANYRQFTSPSDYGELSFEYSKTWSLYIAQDASRGGDYEAYFHPVEVRAISNANAYALRVRILNQPFDTVASSYDSLIKDGKVTLSVQEINGETANIYTGTISNDFYAKVALIKIRDKTVVLRTDSQDFFEDFDRILSTIKYNK